MLGLKLNHVSKMSPWSFYKPTLDYCERESDNVMQHFCTAMA